jgi:hypothetical protein
MQQINSNLYITVSKGGEDTAGDEVRSSYGEGGEGEGSDAPTGAYGDDNDDGFGGHYEDYAGLREKEGDTFDILQHVPTGNDDQYDELGDK